MINCAWLAEADNNTASAAIIHFIPNMVASPGDD
jgi:hypothetical protein